jgi:hypothetical protein
MSFALTMTRTKNGKTFTRAAGSVQVCEKCFTHMAADGDFGKGADLLAAMLEGLSRCYSSLLDDEPKPAQPLPMPLLEGQQCLL